MTKWSLVMLLVLMVFGGSSSVAQDETEELENVVFDYLILPPMEDDPESNTKPRPKKISQRLPVNSDNAKNLMVLEATAIKQAPQTSLTNIETGRHPHHSPAPPPVRHSSRNPEQVRRMQHSPAPPRPSAHRVLQPPRHSHYSPEVNPQFRHGIKNPQQDQIKPHRARHRHHDPNSPRHAHHKLKSTQEPYVTERPQNQYHSIEKIRIADPNPDNIENSFVSEKTGIPYLDSGSITEINVNPENNASPYNPEIKIENYENFKSTMNLYNDPEVSALPYIHPDITVASYAADETSIKPYDVNSYRESEVSPMAFNIQARTEESYYAQETTEHSTRRLQSTESFEESGRRKYKYYKKPQVDTDDFDNNTYGPSKNLQNNRHYHQLPQVEKRDDYFTSYDREYSMIATKRLISTTPSKPVLECYSCYSSAKTTRACIDPSKNGVGVLPCNDHRELCYSTFLKSGNLYLSIQRGCMLECHDSIVTECCNENRCNSKKPPAAIQSSQKLVQRQSDDCATQNGPPTVLFFLTILLLLHTVVKVVYL